MSDNRQKRKRASCANRFHYCTSCGWDAELHPLSEGYCSEECLVAEGGETYWQIVDADEEAHA